MTLSKGCGSGPAGFPLGGGDSPLSLGTGNWGWRFPAGGIRGWACPLPTPLSTVPVTDGLKRRPGCGVRGSFAVWSGGAAPGYLLTNCKVRGQSLQDGRVCSLLRGHRSPVSGTASSPPPAVGRVRDRGAGSCRGAPAANCTHGRHAPIDPAPCSRVTAGQTAAGPATAQPNPARPASEANQCPARSRGCGSRRSPAGPSPCREASPGREASPCREASLSRRRSRRPSGPSR